MADVAIDDILDRVERFRDTEREVRLLTGGLTNTNYVVKTADGAYVVRVSDPGSSLLAIDRDNEEHNARAAATTGVSPAVFERLTSPLALVVGYVPSETMSPALICRGDRLTRIAEALRTLHSGPRFRDDFDMFDVAARYLDIVTVRGLVLPDRYLDHRRTIDGIRAAFDANPEPTVPCNNDLLAENILDDGQQIWFIDFEYSGNNEASFELGNLASESGLSEEMLAELVAAYWGEPRPDKVARARLWGLVAKYGWTLWGIISESINDLDFDFRSWAMEKYDTFEAVVGSPHFDDLLAATQRSG